MKPSKASTSSSGDTQVSRRRLFVGAGAAGAVGALAAATSTVPLTTPDTAVTDASASTDPEGGYRLTPHVLRYYQTAKV